MFFDLLLNGSLFFPTGVSDMTTAEGQTETLCAFTLNHVQYDYSQVSIHTTLYHFITFEKSDYFYISKKIPLVQREHEN